MICHHARNSKSPAHAPIIGVHLDLKGMNFRPDYLPAYLEDLASQRVNTVLVEYEDAFPFSGLNLAHDPSATWTGATLACFQAEARKHRIQVIPLQQCLGHLEYVLSWERYRHLAEERDYPTTLRLANPAASQLLIGMLEQIIAAHPDSKYVHLGMDEAHGLGPAAVRLGQDPLDLFLAQLRPLLELVERAGKVPIIWSDMLERHYRPGAFDEFKGRLVMMPWYYFCVRDSTPLAPVGGRRRISRSWLKEPDNPEAPPISREYNFVEDLPLVQRRIAAQYRVSDRAFKPLPQVDLWTQLGMKVVGGSALRFTFNGSVLPLYNQQFCNVRSWSKAILEAGQLGQIGTSWARATTWYPPNLCIDLQWPIVTEMARSMGEQPSPFWPGIPAATLARLFKALGRCREDWRIEGLIADEMESLAPRLKAHQFEWRTIILMARTMELQRRADAEIHAVDVFHAENRLIDSEWRRRRELLARLLAEIAATKAAVHDHLGRRYHGAAFEEWVRHLFDLRIQRLEAARKACIGFAREAKRRYAELK
jgi:hypothetical protein